MGFGKDLATGWGKARRNNRLSETQKEQKRRPKKPHPFDKQP
jgi:hypothetical protein